MPTAKRRKMAAVRPAWEEVHVRAEGLGGDGRTDSRSINR